MGWRILGRISLLSGGTEGGDQLLPTESKGGGTLENCLSINCLKIPSLMKV